MRIVLPLAAILSICLCGSWVARAKPMDAPSGPLSSPDALALPAKAKPKKPIKKKPLAHPVHDQASAPDPAPTPARKSAVDDNPVSVGMKWNGNNDTATQTRTQNYGGTAAGAGAEVGLKLHF